jgi:hypothetical protein
MVASYEAIENWVVAEGIVRKTLDSVRPTGQAGREAGAFWLGSREPTAHIHAVILPHGIGVEEHRGRWTVSPEVFGVVTRWAKPRNLCLLGVAHTHVRGVPHVLSWTDRNLGVRFPDMLAAIIGNGGDDSDYLDWGWYVFEDGDYRPLSHDEVRKRIRIDPTGQFEAWNADASGVQRLRV